MYDAGGGTWNAGLRQAGGRVFLGNVAPVIYPKLHVQGNPEITGGDGIWGDTSAIGGFGVQASMVGGISTGTALVAIGNQSIGLAVTSNHGTMAYFIGSGGVGIGTSSPADKLHVAGDIRVGTGTTGCVKDADGTLLIGACSSDV